VSWNLKRHISSSPNSPPSPAATTTLLTGKKCLITGASRGIGRAIAERFAREGAGCVLVGRNEKDLQGVKIALERGVGWEEGLVHEVVVGDVGSSGFWGGFKGRVSLPLLRSLGRVLREDGKGVEWGRMRWLMKTAERY
jgi:hypothetical protein